MGTGLGGPAEERWQRIQQLWHDAVGLAVDRRREWLEQACGEDLELLQEVESLLHADVVVNDRYERLVDDAAAALRKDAASPTKASRPQRLGYLELGRSLGSGGMGQVFEARDERLDRMVAVKLLRPEMAIGGPVKARLLREARLLADLEHPSICRIHDIIEERQTLGIVLERIVGETLSDTLQSARAAGEKIAEAEVLQWAIAIAEAIEVAHAAGVVHRDLKPANVMIRQDGPPIVLDFGIARRTDQAAHLEASHGVSGSDSENLTRKGSVLGTPRYLSPEQARGELAGPAADLFAFGLILRELLTGAAAFPQATSAEEIINRVAHWRAPALDDVPKQFAPLLRRLLAAAPGARPSATEVRQGLEALRDAPRARRRRQTRWAAVALLALFGAIMSWQAFRVSQEAERARQESLTADRVSAFLIDLFHTADPYKGEGEDQPLGEGSSARDLVIKGIAKLDTELRDEPLVRARLQAKLSDIALGLGMYQEAQKVADDAANILADLRGPLDIEVIRCRRTESVATSFLGDLAGARASLETSAEILRPLEEHREDLAATLWNIVAIGLEEGDYRDIEGWARESMAVHRALGGDERQARTQIHLALAWNGMGQVSGVGELKVKAKDLLISALASLRELSGPDHPNTSWAEITLALTMSELGECETALDLGQSSLKRSETSLGPNHPAVWEDRSSLGEILQQCGQPGAAIEVLEAALPGLESAYGEAHYQLLGALEPLAQALFDLGKLEEASAHWQRALTLAQAADFLDDERMTSRFGLARVASARGDLESEELFRRLLSDCEEVCAVPLVRQIHLALADFSERSGRPEETAFHLETPVP